MSIRRNLIRWLTRQRKPREFPLSDFDRLQHEIRPCDVLLIEGRNRMSDVIKYMTRSAWSHAALYIGRLGDIEDPVLRRKVAQHYPCDEGTQLICEGYLGEGFRVTTLKEYREDHIRICRPKGLSYTDTQAVMAYAIHSLDKHYSVRHVFDLFRFLLPWRILPKRLFSSLFTKSLDEHSDICSSMIAHAFIHIDFPILPEVKRDDQGHLTVYHRDARLSIPCDFDYSPFFEIIKYAMFNIAERSAAYRKLPWGYKYTSEKDHENEEE